VQSSLVEYGAVDVGQTRSPHQTLVSLEAEGNRWAAAEIRRLATLCAAAAANVVNLIGVTSIIVESPLADSNAFLEEFRRVLKVESLPEARSQVTVRKARFGQRASLLGALPLVLQRLLDPSIPVARDRTILPAV
jgi:predicted NBD/HSP70 family sugar kinase